MSIEGELPIANPVLEAAKPDLRERQPLWQRLTSTLREGLRNRQLRTRLEIAACYLALYPVCCLGGTLLMLGDKIDPSYRGILIGTIGLIGLIPLFAGVDISMAAMRGEQLLPSPYRLPPLPPENTLEAEFSPHLSAPEKPDIPSPPTGPRKIVTTDALGRTTIREVGMGGEYLS